MYMHESVQLQSCIKHYIACSLALDRRTIIFDRVKKGVGGWAQSRVLFSLYEVKQSNIVLRYNCPML